MINKKKIKELLESAKMQINEGATNAEERNVDISDFSNAIKDIDEAISILEPKFDIDKRIDEIGDEFKKNGIIYLLLVCNENDTVSMLSRCSISQFAEMVNMGIKRMSM